MRRRSFGLIMAFFLVTVTLGAWQWPVDPQYIQRSFGFPADAGSHLRGVEFDAEGEDVVAAFDGKVVFRDTGAGEANGPGRSGGMIVLDHENGWRTIYSGLEPDGLTSGERVLAGRTIGTAAESGLRFEMYDRREGFYVNPASLLPLFGEEEEDARISEIRLVSVEDGSERSTVPAYNRVSHRAGETEVQVRVGGERGSGAVTALALSRGGVTLGDLRLERIRPRGGDYLVWNGERRELSRVLDDDGWLRLTTVSIPEDGSISFSARAMNARGQESVRIFTIDGVAPDD